MKFYYDSCINVRRNQKSVNKIDICRICPTLPAWFYLSFLYVFTSFVATNNSFNSQLYSQWHWALLRRWRRASAQVEWVEKKLLGWCPTILLLTLLPSKCYILLDRSLVSPLWIHWSFWTKYRIPRWQFESFLTDPLQFNLCEVERIY